MKNVYEILKNLGYTIPQDLIDYYNKIEIWKKWWEGYVQAFHEYRVTNINKELTTVKRHTLKMAKKVSEDWANMLLNDKTFIIVDETVDVGTDGKDDSKKNKINESQKLLSGDDTEQGGGVLGLSKFWKNGNRAIEKEFALGTSAFILNLYKPKAVNGKLLAESVKINYIKDACCIIPLSYENGEITECAFASSKQIAGKQYLYLQIMTINEEKYRVENKYYLKNCDAYELVKNPNGEVEWYNVPSKPFFIITPNVENNMLDNIPMGLSIYANAIDQLKCCDVAYDNMFNDFILGRKKVFMDQDVISMQDMPVLNNDGTPKMENGKPAFERKPMAGETIEQSLFVSVGERMGGEKGLFQEYNPSLRIEENKNGIQFALNLLSSKVGFGQNKYQFNMQTMATATEVKSSNSDLTESVWKQRVAIQDVLVEMTRSILVFGKELCGKNVNPDSKITIRFDDTMFNDEEAERMRDLQEVRDSIMMDWEYRVKWYGETEDKAKEVLASSNEDKEGLTFDA